MKKDIKCDGSLSQEEIDAMLISTEKYEYKNPIQTNSKPIDKMPYYDCEICRSKQTIKKYTIDYHAIVYKCLDCKHEFKKVFNQIYITDWEGISDREKLFKGKYQGELKIPISELEAFSSNRFSNEEIRGQEILQNVCDNCFSENLELRLKKRIAFYGNKMPCLS